MDPLLEVKNLSVQFEKNKQVLKDVSFSIHKGEIISLIGLNGTGKTTLLKSIVGLVHPSKGAIAKGSTKVAYIPQKSDLNTSFPLTVREFCELFGADDYKKYLDELDMGDFLNSTIRALSGGEYQRVLIAIALSKKPDLLLLDEITTGVDIAGEQRFYESIMKIRDTHNIAIVIVSHNIHLVIKNADQVLCLAGHLCCSGKPEEIKDNTTFQSVFGKYLQPYIHKHDHIH